MNWRTFSVVTGALLILPFSAYAIDSSRSNLMEDMQPTITAHREHHKHGREPKIERLMDKLDLTTEQSQQIDAIKEEEKTQTEALREQMDVEKDKMRSLLSSDANSDQLRQQHQTIQALDQQLKDNHFETMLKMREVLTPDQRAQLSELMDQNSQRDM
ncbi:hypothetical protein NIES4102_28210 [Chondrocystis sp. NIES-4102]|nr:hypothetical protein NIES4102_28210 [Chondrocystis sp. NIES-4102]